MAADTMPLLVIELERVTTLPDGRVVEWEALGGGSEPLVWVEGGPGLPAHLARADVVPVLDRFLCHLVNAPGSGRSSPPETADGYALEAIVGFFEAWRRAVGLGPLTLMGHSWGGLVAPAWAALHPEGVRRLIVISGYAGGGSVDATETAAAEPEDAVSVAHIERLRRELRWHPPIVDAWTGPREDADHRPLLARIRCPTLVITGEHDWICGPVRNRSLADAIPGSRLVVLDGIGHLPQYEAPATFRAVIDDWLDSGRDPS